MKHIVIITFIIVLILLGVFMYNNNSETISIETIDHIDSNNRMTLVLAAPSIHNTYYKDYFDEIVTFQKGYAQKIRALGNDDVRIIVDADTRKYYSDTLPSEILIEDDIYDIWMRDFTTINPEQPIQFVYTDASMSSAESRKTQKTFNTFAKKQSISFEQTDLVLDGGNIVDNYKGRVVTTTRFLDDNNLSYLEGKEMLKELLHAEEVAIIEPDDDVLAHVDGMVAWIDDDILAVNDYSLLDPEFHNLVIDELESSFPNLIIIAVPVVFDDTSLDSEKGIGSACGVNLNLVATDSTLYIPTFNNDYEQEVVRMIRENTRKDIVLIDAQNICLFGGSVRCTTWQTLHDFE